MPGHQTNGLNPAQHAEQLFSRHCRFIAAETPSLRFVSQKFLQSFDHSSGAGLVNCLANFRVISQLGQGQAVPPTSLFAMNLTPESLCELKQVCSDITAAPQ